MSMILRSLVRLVRSKVAAGISPMEMVLLLVVSSTKMVGLNNLLQIISQTLILIQFSNFAWGLKEVKIGDLTCSKQGVEVADKLSTQFLTSQGSDGLLGLAWPKINTAKPQQKTPMQNLMEKNITDKGIFTACLRHEKDGKGFYSFGTILAQEAGVEEEKIEYTPIDNSQGFWAFPSEKVIIGEKSVELKSNTAIADTGTTLALVSDEVVNAIYKEIPGAKMDNSMGGYVYPENAKVPDIQLAVGEKMYTIYGQDLAYGPSTNGMVFGGIQSRGSNPFDICEW